MILAGAMLTSSSSSSRPAAPPRSAVLLPLLLAMLLGLVYAAGVASGQALDSGSVDTSMADIAADIGKSDGGGATPGGAPGGVDRQTMTSKEQCTFDLTNTDGKRYHYDLDALRRPSGVSSEDYTKTIQVGPNIQFVYRMNLCADTQDTCQNEASPATEALKIPAGETCRILGRLSDDKDPIAANHATYELVPTLQTDATRNPSGTDLLITYNNGDMCDPGTQTMRSVSIHLICDTGLAAAETNFRDVKKEATCNTQYILESSLACPTSGGGGARHLIVLLIVALTLYCVIGAAMLRFYWKEEEVGWNLVPHKEFWADVPAMAKEGCAFSVEKVKEVREDGFRSAFGMASGGGEGGGSPPVGSGGGSSTYGSGAA